MLNKSWNENIENIRSKNVKEVSKSQIFEALRRSVVKKVPSEKFGVLLSGGVDSSVIAKICKDERLDFRCFCVGIKGCSDIKSAKEVASILGLELVVKEFKLNDIEKQLIRVIKILPEPVIVDDNYIEYMVKLSVSAVMLSSIELGDEKHYLSGIGAEELFAGYHRHKKALKGGGKWREIEIKDIEEESWDGLQRFYDLVIVRDELISESVRKKIINPYIDDKLIALSMNLPINKKIDSSVNKKILREIASDIGVPKVSFEREKKGAQYGSGFDKAITKLSKQNGFKLKKRYIDSLLG